MKVTAETVIDIIGAVIMSAGWFWAGIQRGLRLGQERGFMDYLPDHPNGPRWTVVGVQGVWSSPEAAINAWREQ